MDPDPDQMPVDPGLDFDVPAQQAYFLYSVLPDKIEGMAGIWLGKDYTGLMDIMDIYSMENKKDIMDYLIYMIQVAREAYAAEREQQSKMRK